MALPPSSLSFLEPARAIGEPIFTSALGEYNGFVFIQGNEVVKAWSDVLEYEIRKKDPLFEECIYG